MKMPHIKFCLLIIVLSLVWTTLEEKPARAKKLSCVIDHPLTVIEPEGPSHLRSLQSSSTHGLSIYGEFPSTTNTGIDIGVLEKIFSIASNYFKQVLKVTTM